MLASAMRAFPVALALLLVAGCAGDDEAASSDRSCGSPSAVETISSELAPGVKTGNIAFILGGVSAGAPATVALEDGSPTKVLIYIDSELTTPVTLRGWRCVAGRRGRPLRFWYRGGEVPLPDNASNADLANAGDAEAVLTPGAPPVTSPTLGYPGYVLFSARGTWTIEVEQDGEIDAATLSVK